MQALEDRYAVRVQGNRLSVGGVERAIPYSPTSLPPALPEDDVVDYVASDTDAARDLMPQSVGMMAVGLRIAFLGAGVGALLIPVVMLAWSSVPAVYSLAHSGSLQDAYLDLGSEITLIHFMGLSALVTTAIGLIITCAVFGAIDFYVAHAQEGRFRQAAERFNANLRARIARQAVVPPKPAPPVVKPVPPPAPVKPKPRAEEPVHPSQTDDDSQVLTPQREPGTQDDDEKPAY